MSSPQPDLHRRIAAALSRIETVMRSQEQRSAQSASLSPLQCRIVETLGSRPWIGVGALARELLVTDGTVSAAVSVLQEKGLVEKRPDPEEHRAVTLGLTPKGKRQRKKLASWPDTVLQPVIEDLGEETTGDLLSALLRVIHAVERRGWIDTTRMCFRCKYFSPWQGKGDKPHRCELLKAAIGTGELQVDCPDFMQASDSHQEECWQELAGE